MRSLYLLFLLGALGAQAKNQVYQVTPRDQSQVDFLDELLKSGEERFDFWSYPTSPNVGISIHVTDEHVEDLKNMLDKQSISYSVAIPDLEPILQAEKVQSRGSGFDRQYHRLREIHNEIRSLASAHSSVASIASLGKSHENREQLYIKIKTGSGKKDLFFFNCGIHAREWISPATCMYIIRQMLETRHSNRDVQYMLNKFEWIILPVFNVDGYEYTHTRNRMWRKTRKRYGNSYGADPNRNFNYHFAGVGTSQSPGSDIFAGYNGFSEIETYNVAKYLYNRRHELKGYIDFHAYSQLWMSPWGYTSSYPPHYDKQRKAMEAAVNALTAVHGTRYKYGPAAITIYPTTGDTTDWTFGVLGVIHSYCVELRPRSSNPGFILPPDQIIPTGQETFAGLKALVKNMDY